jgi:importin-4
MINKDQGALWNTLEESTRLQIKENLLSIAIAETSNLVRHSLAHVISEAAKLELDKKAWPTLVPQLYSFCEHENATHREIGVYVLYTLFDVIADSDEDMKAYIPQFMNLFAKTLSDQSILVAVTTVQALGKVAEYIDNGETQAIVQMSNPVCLPVSHPCHCQRTAKMSYDPG